MCFLPLPCLNFCVVEKKQKNLELVALIGTLLVQVPGFGIEDKTIEWIGLKVIVMHLQDTAKQNTTIRSRCCTLLIEAYVTKII